MGIDGCGKCVHGNHRYFLFGDQTLIWMQKMLPVIPLLSAANLDSG